MAYDRLRYHTDPEYRARMASHRRKYYAKVKDDPEFKAARNAAMRKWRAEHSEHCREYMNTEEYRTKNRANVRRWRKAHPEKLQEYRSSEKYREAQRRYQRKAYREMSEERRTKLFEYRRELYRMYSAKLKRYRTDPEYASSLTEEERDRLLRSADNAKASKKRYYEAHKAECYARSREWAAKNPERRRELARQSYHRCKAKKVGNKDA